MGEVRDLTPEEIGTREFNTAVELQQGKPYEDQIFSADRRVDDPRCAIPILLGIAVLFGGVLGWVARIAWLKWFIN